jgi:hypothetical protein
MIGEKVFCVRTRLNPQFVVDSGAIDVFRQRARIVVGDDIRAVIYELRVLLPADDETLNPASVFDPWKSKIANWN